MKRKNRNETTTLLKSVRVWKEEERLSLSFQLLYFHSFENLFFPSVSFPTTSEIEKCRGEEKGRETSFSFGFRLDLDLDLDLVQDLTCGFEAPVVAAPNMPGVDCAVLTPPKLPPRPPTICAWVWAAGCVAPKAPNVGEGWSVRVGGVCGFAPNMVTTASSCARLPTLSFFSLSIFLLLPASGEKEKTGKRGVWEIRGGRRGGEEALLENSVETNGKIWRTSALTNDSNFFCALNLNLS